MMFIVKNLEELPGGNIKCLIQSGENWVDFIMATNDEYELHESSDWQGVKSLPQAEKDAYASQQERDSILSELSALDLPPYKIERALAGDQQAIDDIKANEVKKNELRQKLAAI